MDDRLQEFICYTKGKFGLENYYLKRQGLTRRVNSFNETEYLLDMEWFPNHVVTYDEDDSNPDGAAVIEMNINTRKYNSVIFVMGETFVKDGIRFGNQDTMAMIKWIESETGLTYRKQFQLHRESEDELEFKGCFEGVETSPTGYIDLKFNQEGQLTLFSIHGPFPSKELVKEEPYTLSLDRMEHLMKGQLKLVEFPSYEQKKIVPVYAVEEMYVRNDGLSTIPFEILSNAGFYSRIDKVISWSDLIYTPFERKEISWAEDITEEQAFSQEPSLESFPITKEEELKCVVAVEKLLRQEYPNDAGKWMLKTLHREKGYIHATLRANYQDNRVFQRKLMIMIDSENFQVDNYIDNKPMLEIYDQLQASDNITITKEEAFEKVKELYVLKPTYVYDYEQRQYVLCGKIDCHHGVTAENGELILLDDLD